MTEIVCYSGFGQLLGTADDGGQTFAGYGQVHAIKKGNELKISGEVLITANTNYNTDHYKTGVSKSAVLAALGITGNYVMKGDQHNFLEVYTSTGVRYAWSQDDYDYTMILMQSAEADILCAGRYYTISGDKGFWESSRRGTYALNNTWRFSFVMTEAVS